MLLDFFKKIKPKLIFVSSDKMGLSITGDHLICESNINQSSIVLDLGGNKGVFSKTISQQFGAKCYCIEPNPILFKNLQSNKLINVFNIAISAQNCLMDFVVSMNDEAGSFNAKIASKWGTERIIKVSAETLNDFCKQQMIDKINLLKIDIEGSEIEVIGSLSDMELSGIAQITVEFHEWLDDNLKQPTNRILERMQRLGFRTVVYSLDNYADVLFLNPSFIKFNFAQLAWYKLHCLLRYKG